MKQLTIEKAPSDKIRQAAIRNGMITLYHDALDKVRQGVSSLDEALMTVREE